MAGRELDGANPKFETLRKDFDRFGFDLSAALSANPVNGPRITHVGHLNVWRNYVAHHKTSMPATRGPFTIGTLRAWRTSCDGLATEFDGILYNQLQAFLVVPPW